MMPETNPNTPLTMAQMISVFQKMQETQNEQFLKALATVVTEIRKPPIDPVMEIRKAREKATKETGEKDMWAKQRLAKTNCSHLRQNGTSNIAWATQSDGIERGVCPYCKSVFTPDDGELYRTLRHITRGMIESVRYVA